MTKPNVVMLITSILFVIGVIILTIPFSQPSTASVDENAYFPQLSITHKVDKASIERDSLESIEKDLSYTVRLKNEQECDTKSLDVIFALDTSSSMRREDLENIMSSINYVFSRTESAEIQFGLVTFSDSAQLIHPLSDNIDSLMESMENIERGFRTNTEEALEKSLNEFTSERNASASKDVLVFITDGTENTEGKPLEYSQALQESGVEIIPIGIGNQADRTLLSELSETRDVVHIGSSESLFSSLGSVMLETLGSAIDTTVHVELNDSQLYSDLIAISNNGSVRGNEIVWDIGTLACQEAIFVTYTLRVHDDVEDLVQIKTDAFVETFSTESVRAEPTQITTVHAPVFDMHIATDTAEVGPATTVTYSIDIINTGSGDGYITDINTTVDPTYISVIQDSLSDNGSLENNVIHWKIPESTIFYGSQNKSADSEGVFSTSFEGVVADNLPLEVQNIEISTEVARHDTILAAQDHLQAVRLGPDLQIQITASNVTDNSVDYLLQVSNNGQATADDISITASYEHMGDVEVVSPNQFIDYENKQILWFVGSLQADASTEIPVTFRTVNGQTSDLSLTASVQSISTDIDTSDNSVTYALKPHSEKAFAIALAQMESDSKSEYSSGETITYIASITNTTGEPQTNLHVIVSPPVGLGLVPDSIDISSDNAELVAEESNFSIDLPRLEPEASLAIEFEQIVLASAEQGSLETSVAVQSDQSDEPIAESDTITLAEAAIFAETQGIETLPQTGSTRPLGGSFAYLRVLLGLLFALPLPILLLIKRSQEETSTEDPYQYT